MKVETNLDIIYEDPRTLLPNPWNPNTVDPINQEKIENSLKAEGFFKPVLVREVDGTKQIIAGEHRVQAAISLGYDVVPVTSLGEIEDGKAKRIGQIDNARYGEDDAEKLADLLASEDIGTANDLLAVLPIDEAELAGFMAHLTLDSELEELDELDNDDKVELETVSQSRTHRILRFKLSVADADAVNDKLAQIRHSNGFTESDDLTNAGDALMYLLNNADALYFSVKKQETA